MENFLKMIRESGSKITSTRKLVLTQLINASKPLTLNDLFLQIKTIDFASVYRTMKLFENIGIVNEILLGDKKIRYEISSKPHHHYVKCSRCGKLKVISICLVNEIEKQTNYKITKHSFEFVGICPSCLKT